jgi:hypothetical protein
VRHAVLIIVLVAAAFAGGAAINEPGLQWVRSRFPRSLLWNDRDINSVDLKATMNGEPAATAGLSPKPPIEGTQMPLAPPPSVGADVNSEVKEAAPATGARQVQGKTHGRNELSSTASLPSTPLSSPLLSELNLSKHKPLPQDQNVKTTSSAKAIPPRKMPKGVESTDSPPAILATLPDLSPVKPQLGDLNSSSSKGSGLHRDGRDDWVTLVGKMKSLGVSQFTIEGEAGGRVVFACLVPLAGRQAITQRFEAEGSDPLDAAYTALRRIALWQAVHEPKDVTSGRVD